MSTQYFPLVVFRFHLDDNLNDILKQACHLRKYSPQLELVDYNSFRRFLNQSCRKRFDFVFILEWLKYKRALEEVCQGNFIIKWARRHHQSTDIEGAPRKTAFSASSIWKHWSTLGINRTSGFCCWNLFDWLMWFF